MQKQKKDKWVVLKTMLEALAMGCATLVFALPAILIMVNVDRLGLWWIPLLMAYFALFYAFEGLLIIPKHLHKLQFLYGSEIFYQMYPEEMKKALRRVRKVSQPEREQVLAAYRQRLESTETDEQHERMERISNILYNTAAVIVLALAIWCFYELIRTAQGGKAFRLSFLFDFLSACMMLTVSIAAFRKSPKMILQAITGVLLFFGIWADLANKLSSPMRYTMAPVYEGLIVLAVFALAGIGLVLVAKRLKSYSRTRKEQMEFNLALYELNVIDEGELAFRMNRGINGGEKR